MRDESHAASDGVIIGRYVLYGKIASGGIATVHFGRLRGSVGFRRTVAIKRLFRQYASDPSFVARFVDEARLASRIHHPHVVQTLDVVSQDDELFVVMEYVQGETLARLFSIARDRGSPVPQEILLGILVGVLHGLHAAHEATNERGEPLGLVHRDVSPQNILVGADGVARLLDFGIAKATGRLQTTRDGKVRGKLAYLAPEQLRAKNVTRRADVYGVSVVLWEGLTGRGLFVGESDASILEQVLCGFTNPPSSVIPAISEELDAITLRGLDPDFHRRFATAKEMALLLEQLEPAPPSKVATWIATIASESLRDQAAQLAAVEGAASSELELSTSGSSSEASATPMARRPIALVIVLALGVVLVLSVLALQHTAGRATGVPNPSGFSSPVPDPHRAAAVGTLATSLPPIALPPPVPTATAPETAGAPGVRLPPRTTLPKDDCATPYVIDATGRRIYKRHCL